MAAQFGDIGLNADHFIRAKNIRFAFQAVDGYFATNSVTVIARYGCTATAV